MFNATTSQFQDIEHIDALQAETAICVKRAAKVAVGSCTLINGFVQLCLGAQWQVLLLVVVKRVVDSALEAMCQK